MVDAAGRVRLFDFDWSGRAGRVLWPPFRNNRDGIPWPADILWPITQTNDLDMPDNPALWEPGHNFAE